MTKKMKQEFKVGEIVQLDPENTESSVFAGCLMIITEVKPWGLQGYVQGLDCDGLPVGHAYYRAAWGTFKSTGGHAQWLTGSAAETQGC